MALSLCPQTSLHDTTIPECSSVHYADLAEICSPQFTNEDSEWPLEGV